MSLSDVEQRGFQIRLVVIGMRDFCSAVDIVKWCSLCSICVQTPVYNEGLTAVAVTAKIRLWAT